MDFSISKLFELKRVHEEKILKAMRNPISRRKEQPLMFHLGTNILEAKDKWDQVLNLFSDKGANRLVSQVIDHRTLSKKIALM